MSYIIRTLSLNIIRHNVNSNVFKYYKKNVNPFGKSGLVSSQNFNIQQSNINEQIAAYSTLNETKAHDVQPSFAKLYEAMKIDAVTLKRIKYNDMCEAVKLLDNYTPTEHELIFLLQATGNLLLEKDTKTRAEVFNKIWNIVLKTSTINRYHIETMFDIYQQNKVAINDVEGFLRNLQFNADIQIYEKLLYVLCEKGNINEAYKLLELLKGQQMKITANCYNALILGHSRAKNIKECSNIMDTMGAANISLGADTYTEYIRALVENKELEKASRLIKENGLLLNEQQIAKLLLSIAIYTENHPMLTQVISLLPDETTSNPHIAPVIRNVTTEMLYLHKYENIIGLLNALPKPNFQLNEDSDTYATYLIKDMFNANTQLDEIVKLCQFLNSSERNTRALHVACERSFKYNLSESMKLLKILSATEPLRPHYFWPLLISNFKTSGEAGIMTVLKCMQEFNCEVDYDTLISHVLPKLSITLKDPVEAIKQLEKCGVKMSKLITPLSGHLLCQKKINDVLHINTTYPSRVNSSLLLFSLVQSLIINKSIQHIQVLAKLVKVLLEKAIDVNYDLAGHLLMEIVTNNRLKFDYKCIKSILDEYNLIGVNISQVAAEVVLQHFSKISDKSEKTESVDDYERYFKNIVDKKLTSTTAELITTNIAHPRDMNYSELECHLVELQSKKLNTRGVLRRLLQLCVREERLERAIELKKLCDEYKVNLSPGMLASVFDLYVKTKMLIDADQTLEQLKVEFPGFLLDEHKIIDYAALLIENNEIDRAKLVLKQRASVGTVKGGQYIIKNVWNLLSKLATMNVDTNLNSINKTKEFLDFMVKLGYCGYHNTLLGPVIRNYLIKNQIKLACNEYVKITAKYKKTPMQLELLKSLVKISVADDSGDYEITSSEAKKLLENIVTASSKVHGGSNANINLMLAFAEEGTDKHLRKLLIDPKFRINSENLLKQIQYMCSDSSKLDVLLKLAKSCRGLGHIIQEYEIYNIILKTFVKENNYNAAIILHEKLMADDEYKISTEFSNNLISLFERNNLEIPTNVAIHTK